MEKEEESFQIDSEQQSDDANLLSMQANKKKTEDTKNKKTKKRNPNNLVVNVSDTKYLVVKKVVRDILKFKTSKNIGQEWDLMWTDSAVQPQQLASMKSFQKINHFPGMFTLSRKNYLARNLVKMSKQYSQQYNFYPKTWVLPSEFKDLKQYMQSDSNCVVIAKPQASCQGRGIFLAKGIESFEFGQQYVVQKYMKKPFLIDGLKFDLRIYVLVAGCDPLRIYVYKEGLARFATEAYSNPKKENLDNLFMHLTNYAINKNNKKFEYNESDAKMNTGHKRSVTSILETLQQLGHDSKKIWNQINDMIVKTIISVQPILSHHYLSCQPDNLANNMCFQILGFDVILDHHLKPNILEVNYTPSFTTDTPLDKLIKENVIKDSLILMNLTSKSKRQILSTKKSEMLKRTLTGKKTWFTKQEREETVLKLQLKRDKWENSHIGNFEKIYPVEDNQQTEKYLQFLIYSDNCYKQVTGGNIKRNTKVSKNFISNENPIPTQSQEKARMMKKTDDLQKIYVKKPKIMIPKSRKIIKNVSTIKKEEQSAQRVQKEDRIKARINEIYKQSNTFKSIEKMSYNKVSHKPSTTTTQKSIPAAFKVHKRPSSAKNREGISSKIVNVEFKEVKIYR